MDKYLQTKPDTLYVLRLDLHLQTKGGVLSLLFAHWVLSWPTVQPWSYIPWSHSNAFMRKSPRVQFTTLIYTNQALTSQNTLH